LVPLTAGLSLVLLGAYGWLGVRVYRAMLRRGDPADEARLYAVACVAGKIPSAYGQLRYWVGRAVGKRSGIIEYKRNGP
jgi:hypothetical protein